MVFVVLTQARCEVEDWAMISIKTVKKGAILKIVNNNGVLKALFKQLLSKTYITRKTA